MKIVTKWGTLVLFFVVAAVNCQYYTLNNDLVITKITKSKAEASIQTDPTLLSISSFTDNRLYSGWTYYYTETSHFQEDWLQGYAAGFMEGYFAYQVIYDTYNNLQMMMAMQNSHDITEFIANQTNWINEMIQNNTNDSYWQLVNTTVAILHGMYDGYVRVVTENSRTDLNLTFNDFYMITYWPDLSDVYNKYGIDGSAYNIPHCSFLLRLTDDDLFAGHTTFSLYTELIKIYKVLTFNFQNPLVKTKRMCYSGQPGSIPSQDDFYTLDNKRFVSETTLSSSNPSVYSWIHYDSVPYWIRITVANLAFDTQQTWADMFFTNRSGTYNNQWLVVDFSQYDSFKNNLTQAQDIIWLVEEFYSLTSQQDVTQNLLVSQGYAASYNAPYSPAILSLSQNPTNYTNDTRATLFKKYSPGINTIEEFKNVMRLNNYSDTGDYCEAIASRCDLNPKTTFPWGAIDCKVTSDELITTQKAWIQDGPTHENLPAFSWINWSQYLVHLLGMPPTFNFDWVFMDPIERFGPIVGENSTITVIE